MSDKPAQVGGSHYDRPHQHVDVMVANEFTYLEAQAMKYIWRHASKNGSEDIAKAIHYLLFILKHDYNEIDDSLIESVLGELKNARDTRKDKSVWEKSAERNSTGD